ncbi:Uncharacterised protein [Klebsiella pneumoniae]|nr:Uncharacterised protein [Klebsiella pneumoniae]
MWPPHLHSLCWDIPDPFIEVDINPFRSTELNCPEPSKHKQVGSISSHLAAAIVVQSSQKVRYLFNR